MSARDMERLVRQLGAPFPAARKRAAERLRELGPWALDALRQADGYNDPMTRQRAAKLYKQLKHPTREAFEKAREARHKAFLEADYQSMARVANRVVAADRAGLADWVWLGNAYQLIGNWTCAVQVYDEAVRFIDRVQGEGEARLETPRCDNQFIGIYRSEADASRNILVARTAMIELRALGDRQGAARRMTQLKSRVGDGPFARNTLYRKAIELIEDAQQQGAALPALKRAPPYDNPRSPFSWTPAPAVNIGESPHGGCSLAELPNGAILAAWADKDGNILACRRSPLDGSWEQPALLPCASPFKEYAPALSTGRDGTTHLVFLSKRLCMVDRDGGEDTLFHTSTRDGRSWTPLLPATVDLSTRGRHQTRPWGLPLPDGSFHLFWGSHGGVTTDLRQMPLLRVFSAEGGPATPKGLLYKTDEGFTKTSAMNPHVTLMPDGRYWLVVDDFGQSIALCTSTNGQRWSRPTCLVNHRASHPQLVSIRGKTNLLYEDASGTHLALLVPSATGMEAADPVRITTGANPSRGARALTTRNGATLLIVGDQTTWLLEASAK